MRDCFKRDINYLRVSVTDRCNFRCAYCMPPGGVELLKSADILSYEEILRVITVLGRHGVDKVRLTGGEPLVRKDIVEFIAAISSLKHVRDLSMTTNGSLLKPLAHRLKAAGLNRVNISLDTLDPERFSEISGGGLLTETLEGIESAIDAGLNPVKINVVLTSFLSGFDLDKFIEIIHLYPISIRFIEYMPLGDSDIQNAMSTEEVKRIINNAGYGLLEISEGLEGNGPAKYYKLPNSKGTFGFITPVSDHFCGSCNRIRLTADGRLKPCLLSNHEVDIRTTLRSAYCDDAMLAEIFYEAIQAKQIRHNLYRKSEYPAFQRRMSQIGG